MNPTLRYAQREVRKLKHLHSDQLITINLRFFFDDPDSKDTIVIPVKCTKTQAKRLKQTIDRNFNEEVSDE